MSSPAGNTDGDLSILPPQPGHPISAASVFVFVIWAALLVANVAWIAKFSTNLPWADEWLMVPVLAGQQPVTLQFLWEQHNEFRLPLPRLIYLVLARVTGCDFRTGMYVDAFALGGLAAALILAARRLRGWISYADAFFPLAILHLGIGAYVSSYALAFVASTIVTCTLLVCILRSAGPSRSGPFLIAGICLILSPLCGAPGLPFVLFLSGWLAYAAILHWRSGQPGGKRTGLLLFIMTATALLFLVWYFRDFHRPPHHSYGSSIKATLITALQFASMSLGAGAIPLWPYSGVVIGVLASLSVLTLWLHRRHQAAGRLRNWGFLLFLAACVALSLATGWGRASMGGLADRYGTLTIPLLCCTYFILTTSPLRTLRVSSQVGLLFLMCLLLLPNMRYACQWGTSHHQILSAMERDVKGGVPGPVIAARYPYTYPYQGWLESFLHMLHGARIGVCRHLNEDGYASTSLCGPPIVINQMTWKNGQGMGTGNDPYLVFSLPGPKYVYGIRLKYSLSNPEDVPALFQAYWKNSDQAFSPSERVFTLPLPTAAQERSIAQAARWCAASQDATASKTTQERMLTIPVDGVIDQFRIDPDVRPCSFRISALELLLKP